MLAFPDPLCEVRDAPSPCPISPSSLSTEPETASQLSATYVPLDLFSTQSTAMQVPRTRRRLPKPDGCPLSSPADRPGCHSHPAAPLWRRRLAANAGRHRRRPRQYHHSNSNRWYHRSYRLWHHCNNSLCHHLNSSRWHHHSSSRWHHHISSRWHRHSSSRWHRHDCSLWASRSGTPTHP